jgi:CHASE2 domain-containing sensor protein
MVKATPTISDLLTFLCQLPQMGSLKAIWEKFAERRGRTKNSRARILLWATIAALIFGAIEFGAPLDDLLRMGRNKARQHPASGEIVVVGIDGKSLDRLEKWPWPRRYHAQLADKLSSLGAKSIYFDIDFSSRSDPRTTMNSPVP